MRAAHTNSFFRRSVAKNSRFAQISRSFCSARANFLCNSKSLRRRSAANFFCCSTRNSAGIGTVGIGVIDKGGFPGNLAEDAAAAGENAFELFLVSAGDEDGSFPRLVGDCNGGAPILVVVVVDAAVLVCGDVGDSFGLCVGGGGFVNGDGCCLGDDDEWETLLLSCCFCCGVDGDKCAAARASSAAAVVDDGASLFASGVATFTGLVRTAALDLFLVLTFTDPSAAVSLFF